MRISVVILVFNLEDYLGQAIDSVLAQTRSADEIIVVDDSSGDGSAEVAKSYGSKIRYIPMPENNGALLAALEGVKEAIADVICMLDGDDFWAANKLEIVEGSFSADPELMLLSHDHVRVDESGREVAVRDDTHRNIAAILRRASTAEARSNLLRETILDQRGYWLGSAYSFRKALFDIPKFENQVEAFGSDRLKQTYLDLTIAPFLVLTNPGKHVGYTPATKLFYRVHDRGSLAGNVSPQRALESARRGKAINELIELILRENGATPTHLRRRGLIIREYDYLIALYSGHLANAVRLYGRLALTQWNLRQLAKETKRLAAVAALGPERFLALKQKL